MFVHNKSHWITIVTSCPGRTYFLKSCTAIDKIKEIISWGFLLFELQKYPKNNEVKILRQKKNRNRKLKKKTEVTARTHAFAVFLLSKQLVAIKQDTHH